MSYLDFVVYASVPHETRIFSPRPIFRSTLGWKNTYEIQQIESQNEKLNNELM